MSRRSNFDMKGSAKRWRRSKTASPFARAVPPSVRDAADYGDPQSHARVGAAKSSEEESMARLVADRPILSMTSELGKVMAAARAREPSGERVMHLERGEPDFDTPAHIVEALAHAARGGETHYPDQRGVF